MKKKSLPLVALCAGSTLDAAITDIHLHELGEAGSMVNGVAQDSIGGRHFTGKGFRVPSAETSSASPISGTYVSFDNTGHSGSDYSGNYGANFADFATDNFGVELWVRATDLKLSGVGEIFRLGTDTGALEFYTQNGHWAAGYW